MLDGWSRRSQCGFLGDLQQTCGTLSSYSSWSFDGTVGFMTVVDEALFAARFWTSSVGDILKLVLLYQALWYQSWKSIDPQQPY